MVAGYHLIMSPYACWLSNDPRGSSSHEIRKDVLAELGELHYGRKKVQPAREELREFYETAEPLLRHEVLRFTNEEVVLLGQYFAKTVHKHRYTCYGCAILNDHVHLLIRKHKHIAETMIEHFQEESRANFIQAGLRRPMHPVWGGPGWKVFLNTREDIERTIRYIVANPIKAGMGPQRWEFVQRYDGWLPGGRMP